MQKPDDRGLLTALASFGSYTSEASKAPATKAKTNSGLLGKLLEALAIQEHLGELSTCSIRVRRTELAPGR